jgi:hypothetical protein
LTRESIVELDATVEEKMEQFQKEANSIYTEAQKCGGDKRKEKLSIFNKKMERLTELEDALKSVVSRPLESNSEVVNKIAEVCDTQRDEAVKYINRTNGKDENFHEQVACSILTIYETPANVGDERIKAHAYQNVAELLALAGKKKGGGGLAKLEECLRRGEPEMANEIIDTFDAFSAARSLQRMKAMSALSPEDALRILAEKNNYEPYQKDEKGIWIPGPKSILLKECYDSFERTFEETLKQTAVKGKDKHGVIARQARKMFQKTADIAMLVGKISAIWSAEKSPRDTHDQISCTLKPHAAQVYAVFRILKLDTACAEKSWTQFAKDLAKDGLAYLQGKESCLKSHMAEVKTGQGKSVILGLTCTVLAVMGFDVDCVCYSSYLSKRDLEDFQIIFTHFNVLESVRYDTFQELARRLINERGDVREMTAALCTSEKTTKRSRSTVPQNKNRVLLIDEVDVFFSNDFFGNTYDAVAQIKGSDVDHLLRVMWDKRESSSSDILSCVKKDAEYAKLMARVKDAETIVRAQLLMCIRELKDFIGDPQPKERPELQYKIVQGKVCYKTIDTLSSDVSFGYRFSQGDRAGRLIWMGEIIIKTH